MEIPSVLNDFKQFVRSCLAKYFGQPVESPVAIDKESAALFDFIKKEISDDELIILLTAIAPHFQPAFFDDIIRDFMPAGGDFPEFGGLKGTNTRYMLPTGDTALFLLAANSSASRHRYFHLFGTSHWFWKDKIVWLEEVKEGEPKWSGRLVLADEVIDRVINGQPSPPRFGTSFPAKLITTRQSWGDLVLPATTQAHLKDLHAWLQHNNTAMQDPVLSRKIKPGYRALFYGPSGAGKTLVATLLGQEFQKDVYRIDLSQVVSKYIGETEKNLEAIFSKAENHDWILFFDEADALFGKRSNVQNAHDKYANQEVSYLLQRVEDFPGMVILASNFKANIDQAFLRRFNSIIEFPMPGPHERLLLWQKGMPETIAINEGTDLKYLADKYELTGSSISQVIHNAVLQMHFTRAQSLSSELLLQGIMKELKKEDKLLR